MYGIRSQTSGHPRCVYVGGEGVMGESTKEGF